MNQLDFNLVEGDRRKRRGKDLAALPRDYELGVARQVALMLALRDPERETDAARVMEHLSLNHAHIALGNAAGSIFTGAFAGLRWEFSGKWIKSNRVSAHSRMIRVWRLK